MGKWRNVLLVSAFGYVCLPVRFPRAIEKQEGYIMKRRLLRGFRQGFNMIKKFLTLKVAFDNILSIQKYKKETRIPKKNICVLGISKL